jgi:hypothetical protein
MHPAAVGTALNFLRAADNADTNICATCSHIFFPSALSFYCLSFRQATCIQADAQLRNARMHIVKSGGADENSCELAESKVDEILFVCVEWRANFAVKGYYR